MIKSKINKIVKKLTRENKYCLNKQQIIYFMDLKCIHVLFHKLRRNCFMNKLI